MDIFISTEFTFFANKKKMNEYYAMLPDQSTIRTVFQEEGVSRGKYKRCEIFISLRGRSLNSHVSALVLSIF